MSAKGDNSYRLEKSVKLKKKQCLITLFKKKKVFLKSVQVTLFKRENISECFAE